MLIEKLRRCSDIGSKDGLYFLWNCLRFGETEIETLTISYQHSSSNINLNLSASLFLFQLLGIIEIEENIVKLADKAKSFVGSTPEMFVSWLSEEIVLYVINNKVLDLSHISYDPTADKYLLPKKSIKLKDACFRNLLLSFDILDASRADGQFYINMYVDLFLKQGKTLAKKMSLQELLQRLDDDRQQGEEGEAFVLKYEQHRLSQHPTWRRIKIISEVDVSAGFDIISYENEQSALLDRFIEVKTYKGTPHFFWSKNERSQAKLNGAHYFIYLVDYTKIGENDYEPIIIQNPYMYFHQNEEWMVEEDTIRIQKRIQ